MKNFEQLTDGGQFVVFHVDETAATELHIALFSRLNQLAMLDKQGLLGDLSLEIGAVNQLLRQFEIQDKRQNREGERGDDIKL